MSAFPDTPAGREQRRRKQIHDRESRARNKALLDLARRDPELVKKAEAKVRARTRHDPAA